VAVATAYALAFVVVYLVSVRTERGRLVSDASLRGAIASSPAVRGTVDAVLDVVSVGSLLGAVAVVAMIALVRLDRLRGLAAIAVLCSANFATYLLKEHLLSRPDLGLDEVAPATLNSLPSGHATAAFSAVAALLLVLPTPWRVPTAVLGGGFVTATAMATLFAGWHRAADSVAAFLVVGICAVAASGVLLVLARHPPAAPAAGSLRWWVAGSAGALGLGVAVAVGLAAVGFVRDTLLGSLFAFLAAALVIVGTMLGVLAGILWSLQVSDRQA
jgi:membrane-associated phospholipid phosphatase